jgi:anti-sigma factor RsiW
MTCAEFRRWYSAYRDGTDPALAAEMDDHMEVCPACAKYDRAVREGVEALRRAVVFPSPDFASRLAHRIATAERVPDPVPPRVSPLVTTAAALLLVSLAALTVKDSLLLPPEAAAEQTLVVAKPRLLASPPFVAFERD